MYLIQAWVSVLWATTSMSIINLVHQVLFKCKNTETRQSVDWLKTRCLTQYFFSSLLAKFIGHSCRECLRNIRGHWRNGKQDKGFPRVSRNKQSPSSWHHVFMDWFLKLYGSKCRFFWVVGVVFQQPTEACSFWGFLFLLDLQIFQAEGHKVGSKN